MSNKIKKITFGLILTVLTVIPAISSAAALPKKTATDVYEAINNIGNLLYQLLMAAAVISLIWAAFNFLTAQGDPEKIKSARNFVIYALIGVLVATLSIGLMKFVEALT